MDRSQTQNPRSAIEVRDLRRSYGSVPAVRGVSFEVARGEVFCLLGPNGAGKTTIVEILEGYRRRSGGDARVLGIDPSTGARELHEQVGIVLQQCGVQSDLTVAELLEMYGRYHVRNRPVDEVLELVELTAKRNVRAKALSGGQRRRLDLALALVGEPELIFLDEPTTGFDPAARRQAWETIRSLCSLGKTVFLTTHFMDEAQYLADRVAVMREGEIIAIGQPDELGGRDVRPAEIRFSLPPTVALGDLPPMAIERCSIEGDRIVLETREPVRAAHQLTGWALERGVSLGHFSVAQPSLEDIYLELTQGDEPGPVPQNDVTEEVPLMSTLAAPVPRSSLRRDLGLVGWQIRYEQRAYWRNRGRGIFTFAFPIMFLAIFASLDKGQHIASRGGIPYNDFFVPGILAYGVIATTFVNLAISTAILRDEGVLKRMQGTPLPRWAYVAARIASTFLIMIAMTVVVIGLGAGIWGLHFRLGALPGLVVTLLLGTAAFTSIGIGLTRFIPTAESGPVVVNLLILPLTFISNIWFPTDALPSALKSIANVFPIKALASGLQYVFDPRHGGAGLNGSDLRTLAIWTVVGVFLMVRFLAQPQGEVA